jgi:hypothetical protein
MFGRKNLKSFKFMKYLQINTVAHQLIIVRYNQVQVVVWIVGMRDEINRHL